MRARSLLLAVAILLTGCTQDEAEPEPLPASPSPTPVVLPPSPWVQSIAHEQGLTMARETTWNHTFRLLARNPGEEVRVGYEAHEADGGIFSVCILVPVYGPRWDANESFVGYACHLHEPKGNATVTLNPGRYMLAFRCEAERECRITYSLWLEGSGATPTSR